MFSRSTGLNKIKEKMPEFDRTVAIFWGEVKFYSTSDLIFQHNNVKV